MRILLALAAAVALCAAPAARRAQDSGFDQSHALWTKVLRAHVVGDRFDYAALKKDRADFDRYLTSLHAVTREELETWTRKQRFAFWINAYNAHAVALVLTEYPVDSIKEIGGWFHPVWEQAFIDMPSLHPSGKPGKLSLDDIEHSILRPRFEDARVHAAINCASRSCPRLRDEAYVAERLDEQLDDAVARWLADPERNQFDREKSRARISRIFDWFEADFVRDGGSVLEWIATHGRDKELAWLTRSKIDLGFLDYSWKLNDVRH